MIDYEDLKTDRSNGQTSLNDFMPDFDIIKDDYDDEENHL